MTFVQIIYYKNKIMTPKLNLNLQAKYSEALRFHIQKNQHLENKKEENSSHYLTNFTFTGVGLVKDEPPVLLGGDKGANPVEYLLAGLAGCITTSLVAYAAAKGVKIDSIESTLEGDIDLQGLLQIDESVNPGYQGINISFKIESDASEATLQELIDLAKKVSPVANTISRPTSVNVGLVN